MWLFHDSSYAENSTQYFWGQIFFQQEASTAMEMCTIHITKSWPWVHHVLSDYSVWTLHMVSHEGTRIRSCHFLIGPCVHGQTYVYMGWTWHVALSNIKASCKLTTISHYDLAFCDRFIRHRSLAPALTATCPLFPCMSVGHACRQCWCACDDSTIQKMKFIQELSFIYTRQYTKGFHEILLSCGPHLLTWINLNSSMDE